jgi:hypothetical protein
LYRSEKGRTTPVIIYYTQQSLLPPPVVVAVPQPTKNYAPVLSLWTYVLARQMDYTHRKSYRYAQYMTSYLANSKGIYLGLITERHDYVRNHQQQLLLPNKRQSTYMCSDTCRIDPIYNDTIAIESASKNNSFVKINGAERYVIYAFGTGEKHNLVEKEMRHLINHVTVVIGPQEEQQSQQQ